MNYRDFLQSPEWVLKQNQILDRDNNTCKRCGHNHANPLESLSIPSNRRIFFKDLDISLHGGMKIVEYKDDAMGQIYCKTPKTSNTDFIFDNSLIVFNLVRKDTIQYPFNGGSINNVKSHFGDKNSGVVNFIKDKYKDVYDFEVLAVDNIGFYLLPESRQLEFMKSNLQVHHRCYKEGMQWWAQPDEDYITLCNVCHRIIHEHQLIPILDADGSVGKYLRPCWKCGGTRHFDCYSQASGFCYECDGEGFKKDSPEWQKYINSFRM